jgi:predicted ATPase
LIGRDDDLARIGTLLAAGRLVTVLGPGGAGKTRLAVEAARRHQHEYRDGAWMIDLAPVTEPAKVGAAVLGAIGLRGGARPEGAVRGDDLDVLAGRLGGRESLLLVDNCEHLIDAVAHLLEALLPRCPGLRVLATSREPLAIAGEALVPLGPLALPGPGDGVEQARRTASVRLFTERAAAVRPGFGVDEHNLSEVLRVVRDLDGMPLVLELAAARLRTLSLTDLAAGLSDRLGLLTTGSRTAVPRHRTLRAVIAWSWDLLGADARTVAERISVLPGGVTPASAAAVCAGTGVPAGEILELLAGLVDRSLVQLVPDAGRYRMLSTIREYGLEGLAGPGTLDRVRNLAARYLAELVARHDPRLRGPDQLAALRVISAEYDNVLDALRHLAATGDADGAVALTLNLTWYWQMLGRDLDASSWLGQALAVPGGTPGPGRDCARAIHLFNRGTRAGVTAEDRDQLRELAGRLVAYPELPVPYGVLAALPLAFLEPAAALAVIDRPAGGEDGWLSGMARMFRAEFAENAGEIGQMRTDVEAALAGFRQAGDRWGQAAALPMRAQLRQYDGDLDGALADLSGAEALAAEFGSLSPGAQVYDDLRWSDLHRRRGEVDSALARLGAARERALRADSGAGPGVVVDVREAELRVRLGDLDRAGELLDGAGRALSFTGDHVRTLFGAVRASLALELGDRAGAKEWLAEAYALARATGDLPILAVVAVTVAALAGAYGRHHESALLVGAAARLRGTHDRSDPQVRELIRRGRAALGEDAFAIAYEKGWELDAETAVTAVDPAVLAV